MVSGVARPIVAVLERVTTVGCEQLGAFIHTLGVDVCSGENLLWVELVSDEVTIVDAFDDGSNEVMDDLKLEVRGSSSMSLLLLLSRFEDPTADMVDFRRLRASTGDV